jgi:hypothetical protein
MLVESLAAEPTTPTTTARATKATTATMAMPFRRR